MKLALNSVTLRSYTPTEVVSILKDLRIEAIEWAGDAHVPPDDTDTALSVRRLCEENGIQCTSYGSYYQCDLQGSGQGPFRFNKGPEATLETAAALGVDAVRVWAGRKGSSVASAADREEVADCLRSFCDQAAEREISVHLEFHRNTLTDTADSALDLMDAVSRVNLFTYWQPRNGVGQEENVEDIHKLGEAISHAHVFHWLLNEESQLNDRRPLKEGRECWEAYFAALNRFPRDRFAMMEFVRDESLEQLKEDLSVLRLINGCSELVEKR